MKSVPLFEVPGAPAPTSAQDEQFVQRLREQLPALQQLVYFNAGTNGPLPKFSAQAAANLITQQSATGLVPGNPLVGLPGPTPSSLARRGLAQVLGARPDDLALTAFTTGGMNIVVHGLDWQPGDEVITTTLEHPGLLTPLSVLARRRGVRVRFAPVHRGQPEDVLAAVEKLYTPRTKLLALSHVFWNTGAVAPVLELAEQARQRHVLTLIDGAQSAGAIPLALRDSYIDFYAVPGQKWLMGPDATGGLYVAPSAVDAIQPTFASYFTARMQAPASAYFVPHDGARRYDSGGLSQPLLAALAASCTWLAETAGLEWIQSRIAFLIGLAREKMAQVPGLTVLTPATTTGPVSGLLTVKVEGQADNEVVAALTEQGFYVRSMPLAPYGVRLSVGFYNLAAEVERVVDALSKLS